MFMVKLQCTVVDPRLDIHADQYTWQGDVALEDSVECAKADASLAFRYLYGNGTQVGFNDAQVREYLPCAKCHGCGKIYDIYGDGAKCPSCQGKGYTLGKVQAHGTNH